ncbi:hypothetical protein BGZ54_003996 [Gamsiella multidivaricata]|nr:hypothetical protein BGZ54_003996 [Gamsiella multidivaricata]
MSYTPPAVSSSHPSQQHPLLPHQPNSTSNLPQTPYPQQNVSQPSSLQHPSARHFLPQQPTLPQPPTPPSQSTPPPQTAMAALEQADYGEPTPKRTIRFGLVSRSSDFEHNTVLLLQAMLKFPPFVKFDSRAEAWAIVAAELRHTGGQDLKYATNHVCEKRYREVKGEFQKKEAESQIDTLVKELVALETAFEERQREQNQTGVDDLLSSSFDQFEGYLSREETMNNMRTASTASSSSLSSSSIMARSPQRVTAQSVRHNSLPSHRRRSQPLNDEDDKLKEEMFKTLKNLNELIDLAKSSYG